ncbi:MAG: T9SS type A sorting domain-containing protein [Bacteroidetes bacterium]|nr:T9SS type A sorting domain-containing protein [Bacteroidota bacterium]
MKKILPALLLATLSTASMAQNYYHIEFTDDITKSYIYGDYASGKVVMSKPSSGVSNDVYSAKQTIPFSFKFYGQEVTEYLVSDNGYITFNTSATNSTGQKMALPAGGDPNNAIYAFWNDFEMKAAPNASFPVNVYSYTKGTSPNRMHVIQWFGISNQGTSIAANSDVFAFALVLHEQDGMFDVVNGPFGSSSIKGTIGAENADGSVGYSISGSPNFSFPVASGSTPDKLTVYRFYYGVQAANDAGVVSSTLPRMVSASNSSTVGARVVNFGTSNITSFDLNYTVDGGAVQTKSFTGYNIPAGSSIAVNHDIKWNSGNAGVDHSFEIYTSNINGSGDDNSSNDSYSTNVLVNSGTTTTRRVLAEESSGAWCGYCPDGHVTAKTIMQQYPDVIFVIQHYGDAMQTTESYDVSTTFASGYPNMVADRTLNPGSSRTAWPGSVSTRRSVGAPASIEIMNKNFNPTTRVISYDVKVTFVDDYAGDIRIGAIISEDKVRGPDNNQWTQTNYYSKDYPNGVGTVGHPMYEQHPHMEGYYHNHVAIAMPNGAWGKAGIIPEVVKAGSSYTTTISYTLPAMTVLSAYSTDNNTEYCSTLTDGEYQYGEYKPADISLIAFVSTYDDFIKTNRPILNAAEVALWDRAAGVEKTINSNMNVYPNPANTSVTVQLAENTSTATVKIMDLNGKVVKEATIENGNGTLSIDGLTNGIYVIEVAADNFNATQKLIVTH